LQEGADQLQFLEAAEVIIQTKKPLALTNFSDLPELGKFVLIKNDNTVAGGIVAGLEI